MTDNKERSKLQNQDKIVEKIIEEWDIVKCLICGEKISMLTSTKIRGDRGYICKGKHNST